jgi:hypothetical protein
MNATLCSTTSSIWRLPAHVSVLRLSPVPCAIFCRSVAAIHSELLRAITVKDLAEMFPKRFSNKTNGVTPAAGCAGEPGAGSGDHAGDWRRLDH